MNLRVVRFLYKKEILDVLRDKKTVLMMLVVPLVIYPLMMVVSMQLMAKVTTSMEARTYNIAFDFEDENDYFKELFEEKSDETHNFKIVQVSDMENELKNEEIDAYISKKDSNGKEVFYVHYMSSVTNSNYATDIVSDVVKDYAKQVTEKKVADAGLDTELVLHPVEIEFVDSATSEQSAGSLLGMLIPFMLVVSLLMGTMYPAIDTTSGERERGTLETMLTLPITNKELITSKFLVVATIGIVSAILNIVSMCGVGFYMYKMMGVATSSASVDMSKFIPAIVVGVLCILAFAIFISAITMCVCAFAKSYKEANNYITPLMLAVMFASFVAFIPNVELNKTVALIPVANICLLLKNLLVFKYNVLYIGIVLISNIAYGLIAVMFLSRVYNSETILFGDDLSGIQLFERRSNMVKGGVPTKQTAVLLAIIMMLFVIYLGGYFQVTFKLAGVFMTQIMMLAMVVLSVVYTKKDIVKTFRLRGIAIKHLVGAIVMVLGGILAGIVISTLVGMVFKESYTAAAETFDIIGNHGFVVTLLVIALTPAICEELVFRGYILSSFESGMKVNSAILCAAAIFGIYHMSVVKFFTTAFLGMLICYVAVKSKSIIPGMIMHFINNAISCVMSFFPEAVGKVFPILLKEKLETVDIVLFAMIGLALISIGMLIVRGKDNRVNNDKIVA